MKFTYGYSNGWRVMSVQDLRETSFASANKSIALNRILDRLEEVAKAPKTTLSPLMLQDLAIIGRAETKEQRIERVVESRDVDALIRLVEELR